MSAKRWQAAGEGPRRARAWSSPGRVLAILAVLALAIPSGCSRRGPPVPKGVLLISVDSLRADHLSCYGYRSTTLPEQPTSPVIDRELAAQGMLFEQAMSTTSWTVPAHMALLTGQPDLLHGVRTPKQLHPSHPLLAEVLRKKGWRTAGFFSGPNVHPWYGFGRGFELYEDCSNAPIDDEGLFAVEDPEHMQEMRLVQRSSHQGVTSPKVVEAFERWWPQVGAGEPFFAFVHLWDVHFDYAQPEGYDIFHPGYAGQIDGANYRMLAKQEERSPDDLARLRSLYDAEILYTDFHIGLILDLLRRSGRLDDTLVVLVSDHGEELYEHGHHGHNRTLFEEVVRVPLIVRHPGLVRAGTRSDQVVSLADVMPTILELCEVRAPNGLWGRSFAPLLRGEPLEPRPAPLDLMLQREQDPLLGSREHGHKVLQSESEGLPELYVLSSDPGEHAPLRPDADAAAKDVRIERARKLWSELKRYGALFAQAEAGELPPDLERELRLLGYTGEDEQ